MDSIRLWLYQYLQPLTGTRTVIRRKIPMRKLSLAGLALLALVTGCSSSPHSGGSAERVTGGGSSLVGPLMKEWAGAYYRETSNQIDYTVSGSGNGVRQMIDQKNDFGCTDAPMNEEQLTKAKSVGGDVVHIPLAMGGVVPAYNLKELAEPLHFSGPVLADIFLGKITRWNDPKLKALNPKVNLPSLDIAVVHRSEGSGTTYVWVEYLSKVSPEWKEKVGVGADVKWPVGIGAGMNDGVASQINRTEGAIGYVELTFALKSKLPYGYVINSAGVPILASLESITKAAEGAAANIPEDLRYSLTDVPGKEAYPICATVWAVIYVKQAPAKAKAMRDYFHWVLNQGQDSAASLSYARLSKNLVEKAEHRLEKLGQ
jgi:phosphate transport system substrate-binding protein